MAKFLNSIGAGVQTDPSASGVYGVQVVGENAINKGDVFYANSSLICNFEGANGATSTTDNSSVGHTITFNGDAQISTARAAVGTSMGLAII